jgi:hypothetical protein
VTGIPGVSPASDQRAIVRTIEEIRKRVETGGGGTAIATGTISFGTGTTTTLTSSAVTASSALVLTPLNAAAASLEGVDWYVSARTAGASLTITHAALASPTRGYAYALIG